MQRNDSYLPTALVSPGELPTIEPAEEQPEGTHQPALPEGFASLFHDLRTPLHSILASVELLEGDLGPPSEAVCKHLARIRRAGDGLSSLIDRILLHARLDTGKIPVGQELILLPDLVQRVADIVGPLATERGLLMQASSPAAVYFTSDSGMIEQILLNLLGNAIKYTQVGGISLSCALRGSEVEFKVSDFGLGISEEHLDKVFDPFWRVPGSQKFANGIGLGLSLVHGLVTLLGGTVEVQSQLGAGTTFWIRLPTG